jgi:hypothetical protein
VKFDVIYSLPKWLPSADKHFKFPYIPAAKKKTKLKMFDGKIN